MRIEDFHLEAFFKSYADKLMAEKFGPIEGQVVNATPGSRREESFLKQEFYKKLQEGVKEGILMIDWRTYRIPAANRKQVLSRYYAFLSRKRVRMQSNIITAAHEVVQS